MAVLDEDIGAALTQADGNDAGWLFPASVLEQQPRDWRSLYERQHACAERERARADAAEARCEELRRSDVDARSRAGSFKWQLDSCRGKLEASRVEVKELRRAVKAAQSSKAEVTRFEQRPSESRIEAARQPPVVSLTEVNQLRKALKVAQARAEKAGLLEYEVRELRKDLQGAETHKETIGSQNREIVRLVAELRRLRDQKDAVKSLSGEGYRLRVALNVSEAQKDKLKARLTKLRATGATLSKLSSDEAAQLRTALRRSRRQKATITSFGKENARLRRTVRKLERRQASLEVQPAKLRAIRKALESELAGLRAVRKTLSKSLSIADAELRRALRRSRRQKATIKSLSRENARLRKGAKASWNRIQTLEAQFARLRATGAVLSKALFGRKSEKQETPRSGRPRGQQRGAPGHGRTRRPGLEEREEEINPPKEARVCSCCGKPYAAIGADISPLVEIDVKAHKRVIRRPRWRRACGCASSPIEVSAPPVPRLFRNTPYGISVWACVLFERYACYRPLKRVAAWLSDRGLPISPGTLADSMLRFVPLFEPVAGAILAHQDKAALRHADETSWRVQELRGEDRSSRAWLWASVSSDAVYFHIDPSRSAEAAEKLFAAALLHTVIVCDRYSAYKRLARLRGGLVTLAFCWSHQRRDFIECAAGQVSLTEWCRGWIERIASIYRLNEARLEHYGAGLERPASAFDTAQGALEETLDGLFAQAERELAGLPDEAREGKALRSLINHREGLSVFVDRPLVPMDNNLAERMLRGPAIGRRLSFGSDSETGARFTAMMYSVVGTLALNGIDVLRWLEAWLEECAKNGRRPPDDLSPWLPWSMNEEHRLALTAPG